MDHWQWSAKMLKISQMTENDRKIDFPYNFNTYSALTWGNIQIVHQFKCIVDAVLIIIDYV